MIKILRPLNSPRTKHVETTSIFHQSKLGPKKSEKKYDMHCEPNRDARKIVLVISALDSYSKDPVFQTTGWFHGSLGLL